MATRGRRYPSQPKRFLALDLGAGSGRAILGTLEAGKLVLEEVHRFANEPVKMLSTLCWDFPRLALEVERGIALAASRAGGRLDGIGVDTWGVDFGLLDKAGDLLAAPVHYRDARTEGMMETVFRKLPRERIFSETGIQFLALNTLYQIEALQRRSPGLLQAAGKILLMADLFHYLLTGRPVAELTLATTTQMWNPLEKRWSGAIVEALGLPPGILPEVVEPGTVLGPLREEIAKACDLASRPAVIATACHDTAAAIAAVPAMDGKPWGYLSSGTWSLLGIELDAPKITEEALEKNFTNEGGAAGKTTFLRNINGLWLIQECRRQWLKESLDLDYARIAALAEEAGPSAALVLPNHPGFFSPPDMPGAIRDFCERTGQHVPRSPGEVARTGLESLALAYREVAEQASALSGRPIERLHIVGGGSRNSLLNQLTANALGIPVVTGPVEATAMGNILLQAMATGKVKSLVELRRIVHASTETREYPPLETEAWEAKYAAYRDLAAAAR